jgi:hypothetical protein
MIYLIPGEIIYIMEIVSDIYQVGKALDPGSLDYSENVNSEWNRHGKNTKPRSQRTNFAVSRR